MILGFLAAVWFVVAICFSQLFFQIKYDDDDDDDHDDSQRIESPLQIHK